jgi:hypothetical protein
MVGRRAQQPAAHEEALYRLAREALANMVKHVRATRAVVTLVRDATVRLLVEDDGVGFGAPPRRLSATGWPAPASASRRCTARCSWRPGPAAGRGCLLIGMRKRDEISDPTLWRGSGDPPE